MVSATDCKDRNAESECDQKPAAPHGCGVHRLPGESGVRGAHHGAHAGDRDDGQGDDDADPYDPAQVPHLPGEEERDDQENSSTGDR